MQANVNMNEENGAAAGGGGGEWQQFAGVDGSFAAGLWAGGGGGGSGMQEFAGGRAAGEEMMGWHSAAQFAGALQHGFHHFAADSSFVERASRLSCFGAGAAGGNLGGMVNAFGGLNPYAPVHGDRHSDGKNSAELSAEQQDEAPNVSAGGGGSSSKDTDSKKRRRTGDEVSQMGADSANGSAQSKRKGKEVSPEEGASSGKAGDGKPKEEYVHIRARRGQATNSHSLAERLRREKISERMKLLQDLVPGCSKVTGKAVMLDEIINYVQSLQRQVEFLSMKLAAVNPRLDLNIEGLLSKELLRYHGGPSPSSLGFPPDLLHPQLQLSQPGLVQGVMPPGMADPDVFRRAIQAQKDPAAGLQMSSSQWSAAGFHSSLQMAYQAQNIHDSAARSQDSYPI